MSRYAVRRPADPLAWVFGIVLGALALIGLISVVVRASVDEESQNVSIEGVTLVGDSTAIQVAAAVRPAEEALRSMSRYVGTSPEVLQDRDTLIAELVSIFDTHRAIAAATVAAADGSVHELSRVADGYVCSHLELTGETTVTWLDADLEVVESPEDAAPPPLNAALWETTDLRDPEIQWGDPVPTRSGRTTATATMTVAPRGGDPLAIAAVRVDSAMVGAILRETPGASYGRVLVAGANGVPLAGDGSLVMPEGERSELGGGVVIVDESLVSYERQVADDLPWTMTVQVEGEAVLPAVAAVDRTMTMFSIAILSITVALALVLWVLRRPAGEVALRARTDALTGLANRHHLDAGGSHVLDDALQRGGRAVVAVFDLDRFKTINDRAGHDSGDAALCAVADALAHAAGPRSQVARYGGDEFAALVAVPPGVEPADAVEHMREAASRALHDAVGSEFDVGVSAGWVEADRPGRRLQSWLGAADSALVSGRRVSKGATYAAARA